jgi:8-oxo-dGTP pyrophosphatase MutT (NUDIX family)
MTQDLKSRLLNRLERDPIAMGRPRIGDMNLNPEWVANPDLDDLRAAKPLRDAAVLVPLVERGDGMHVLLTRRSADLPSHAGQVSFPGGRVHESDADFTDTALRETEEEIGLTRNFVSIAGHLEPYETGTGFAIRPVVGIVRPGFTLTLQLSEVAEAFEVPFSFLMDPANHQQHHAVWQGRRRAYYAMPFGRHYIWGATAGILVALYRRLFD